MSFGYPVSDSNLKLLRWNVRGLNCPARRETARLLLQDHGANLICLQETKLQQVTDVLALETLAQRLNNSFFLPAEGGKGRYFACLGQGPV